MTGSIAALEHETDLVYPSAHDILDYLCRYAETFGLVSRIRFGTRVERLCRCNAGWLVDYTKASERFEKVVVAPHLRRALLFGPLAPSCFRLEGPDALPDGAARFARDAAAFGAITSNELTEREQRYWSLVEGATPTEPSAGDGSS